MTTPTITDEIKAKVIEHHKCNCKMAHEDQCGWYYEIDNGVHNWNAWDHQKWLKDFLKKNTP